MNIEISKYERVAAAFNALGDPTRLRIFELLRGAGGEVEVAEVEKLGGTRACSVGRICDWLGRAMSTVSHHLKELRQAGLIRTEKRGRTIYCSVDPAALQMVQEFLADQPPAGK